MLQDVENNFSAERAAETTTGRCMPAAFSRWKTVLSIAITGCTVAELTNPIIRAARYWDAATCRTPISVLLRCQTQTHIESVTATHALISAAYKAVNVECQHKQSRALTYLLILKGLERRALHGRQWHKGSPVGAGLPEGGAHEHSKEGSEGEADGVIGGGPPVRNGVLFQDDEVLVEQRLRVL